MTPTQIACGVMPSLSRIPLKVVFRRLPLPLRPYTYTFPLGQYGFAPPEIDARCDIGWKRVCIRVRHLLFSPSE